MATELTPPMFPVPGRRAPRLALLALVIFLVTPLALIAGTGRAQAADCQPFTDVNAMNVHCQNIEWLKTQDITKPSGSTFRPAAAVTRGAMVAFLFRLTYPGTPAPHCATSPFRDVPPENVFCGYVQWAATEGISTGYPDGTFRPEQPVTRGAMAAFIQRVVSNKTPPACSKRPFIDVATSAAFCGAITWMKTNGITYGVGDGSSYGAAQPVSRGQMASFLYRVWQLREGTGSGSPTAAVFPIPVTVGNASQIITVTSTSPQATTATLRAWEKRADGTWHMRLGPYTARVGSAGIGAASEGSTRTPQGTFTLTEAFGRLANPGTQLPYRRTSANSWWVSDTRAATYNTWQNCAPTACPFRTVVSERLHYIAPEYDYAVVMDVNRSPVIAGAGSAFFLHVTTGQPTAGCVAISKAQLTKIMKWLSPAKNPRIATGIAVK